MKAIEIIRRRKEIWEENMKISHDEAVKIDSQFVNAVAEKLIEDSVTAKNLRKEIKEEPDLLIEMTFTVVDKHQKKMPFFLNEVQDIFRKKLKQARKDFKAGLRHSLKFLVLKGRQQG